MRQLLAMLAALAVLLGCSTSGKRPDLNLPVADETVTALVRALGELNLSSVPLTAEAQADVDAIVSGMDQIKPEVRTGPISYTPGEPKATVTVTYSWPLPSGPWQYEALVHLVHDGPGWKVVWAPSVLHPKLDQTNRLVHTHIPAKRAQITGNNGAALVEEHDVVKVGIDKTRVSPEQAVASAQTLATVLGTDPARYAAQVSTAGAQAFVVALTLRKGDVPAQVADIPGAVGVAGKAMLTPTAGFATDLIGVVGEATPQIIAASKGAVAAGDQVGLSGLQKRYDEQLRGTPGDRVTIVGRRAPSASTTPGATPAPTASVTPQVIHNTEPVAGRPLALSLDLDLQQKAQQVMSTVPGAAAVAVVRPSSGAVLALANSPASGGQPDANSGRYAPGSTFKIATALALIRKGYTPDTLVDCTPTTTVAGWPFKNYSDFPSERVGKIPLKDAIAASCNTALINEHATISGDDLRAAAASLGVGIDYDAGFPVFYGEVPQPDSSPKKGQELIGQGGVLASPLAMAGLAASVASDRTVIAWLVDQSKPTSTATALTPAEGAALRTLMSHTVAAGSGRVLQGHAAGAKTGTAEYGTGTPLPTHAWMICYTASDLAVAVWVKDGQSGSGTAGPIIQRLLT